LEINAVGDAAFALAIFALMGFRRARGDSRQRVIRVWSQTAAVSFNRQSLRSPPRPIIFPQSLRCAPRKSENEPAQTARQNRSRTAKKQQFGLKRS
jgi:hypothetical protein